jgi:hypothetical protein
MMLGLAVVLLIRLPAVQTYVTGIVASQLEERLGAKVSVDHVYIQFFNKAHIEGIYVEDHQGDTLIHLPSVVANINVLKRDRMLLQNIILSDGYLNLCRYKDEDRTNLSYVIERLRSDGQKNGRPFEFDPGEVNLNNFRFSFRDRNSEAVTTGVNFKDIEIDSLYLFANDLKIFDDEIAVTIDELAFREKSGFHLRYFESAVSVKPDEMDFKDLIIELNRSSINCDINFAYDDFSDFNSFISDIRIRSVFDQSLISSEDIAFFAPEVKGMSRTVRLHGDIKGTVDQLRAKDLGIEYGRNSSFKGDISISGLPDIENSFIDLVVDDLVLNSLDIGSVPLTPFGSGKTVDLPKNLNALGNISFTGKFTGFITDFVAFGNLRSDLGRISSDLNLKISDDPEQTSYQGHMSVFDFNIGRLFNNDKVLGRTSLSVEISGNGFTKKYANAELDGNINYLELFGYKYRNIDLDGRFESEKFNGAFSVLDSNLYVDFFGLIDYSDESPTYNFTTCIENAKLSKLNILDRDSSSTLTVEGSLNVKGDQIHSMSGNIDLFNIIYSESGRSFEMDEMRYMADKEGVSKSASIASTLFDFSINGVYNTFDLIPVFDSHLDQFIPTYRSAKNRQIMESSNFNYSIKIKDTEDILKIFFPDLELSPGTEVSGGFNNESQQFSMIINSDQISYRAVDLNDVFLDSYILDNKLHLNNTISDITINDTTHIKNVRLHAATDKESVDATLHAAAPDSMKTNVTLSGRTLFKNDTLVVFKILDHSILLDRQNWIFDPLNELRFSPGHIELRNSVFHDFEESVKLNGVISADVDEDLEIVFENFDLYHLNPLLSLINLNVNGIMNGSTMISSALASPGIDSDLSISTLSINNDTLGDAHLDVEYDTGDKIVYVKARVDKGGVKNIHVNGTYEIGENDNLLDFDISFEKTQIGTFAKYVEGVFSEVRGLVRGDLKLKGTSRDPELTGKLRLQKTSFIVDYLNTRYSLADEVHFTRNAIEFRSVKVNDMYGNIALVNGALRHDRFRDLRLDLKIDAKNFQMLNTTIKDNELFYGVGFGSGVVTMKGPVNMITMDMNIRTNENTVINIPLSNPEEISSKSFINFVIHDSTQLVQQPQKQESIGFDITIDLKATEDAQVQLIFDSKIGDVMKGEGRGDLRLHISEYGDFSITGNYRIQSGDYLFTLQNVINKKFSIEEGGLIQWSGDPYEAVVDMRGRYKLKASLYDLIQDTSYRDRIPVEVTLRIREELFNPEISFDINVPDSDPLTDALINRYINSEQEVSRQTMSLLVLGRFSKSDDVEFVGTSTNSVSANASELLSQQLSVWGSQISDDVDIGFNYRAGDSFSQEELEIMLSTQLFNDRVKIDGNFGYIGNSKVTSNENTSDIIGDFNVEVKVSDDGRLRFKAFNRTITNTITNTYNSPYTQGMGILYRQDFDHIRDLFRKHRDDNADKPVVQPDAMK